MRTITEKEVRQALKLVITEMPDNLNPLHGWRCVYTDPFDATKHCVVGQTLVKLGVPLPDVNSSDNLVGVPNSDFTDYLAEVDVDLSPGARDILIATQNLADRGTLNIPRKGWAEAVGDVDRL